jgi:hypothetical protein
MNPATQYPRQPVRLQLSEASAVTPEDFCRNFRPENQRGFANTELYRQCVGGEKS